MKPLVIASRPSDYAELSELARVMAERRHDVTLIYLYSGDEVEHHAGAFQSIESLQQQQPSHLKIVALDMLAIHRGVFDSGLPLPGIFEQLQAGAIQYGRPAPATVAPGIAAKVMRRLRDPQGTVKVIVDSVPATARLMRRVPPALWNTAFTVARRAEDAGLVYSRFHSFFLRAIREFSIEAVILPEDIVGPIWPVAVSAAHRAGVPAVVCPYTLANQTEAVQSLKSEPAFQSSANGIAVYLHPEWRYRNAGVDLVRLPSEHILAHAALGITPPDPWMMNSGYADRILVDSDASREYFEAGGIPAEQISVVGSVSQDRMFEQRQHRDAALQTLRRELALPGSKPLLLISGCPNQLSAPVPGCEFTNMEAVARFVGESIAPLTEHYHVVVRPHPNYLEFGGMLTGYGVTTTTAPTASIVPLADVFVAFASATIRWAVACAIPSVNYDVFQYGYADFASAKGVTTVSGSREFADAIRSLTPGSPRLEEQRVRARQDSARWSVLDGRSIERIEEEIQRARERRGKVVKEPQQHA